MNIELRLPAAWETVVSPDGSVRATSAETRDLEILAAPLTPTIEAKMEWARLAMHRELDVPADHNIKLALDEKGKTVDGWPSWFVIAEPTGGEPRAFAFYFFLDYSGYAQIRGAGAATHIDLLRSARPNYATDEVVALEQLWK